MQKEIVNCITINTDASFCQETGASGYAFYVICDNFKIMKSGLFKNPPRNPNEAEMMCLGNAMAMIYNQKDLPKSNYIIINSDSMKVGFYVNRPKRRFGKKKGCWVIPQNTVYEKVLKYIKMVHCKTHTKRDNVQFRHVKAHSGVSDSRTWVNDWCDKEAKKWMKKQRQQIVLKILGNQ